MRCQLLATVASVVVMTVAGVNGSLAQQDQHPQSAKMGGAECSGQDPSCQAQSRSKSPAETKQQGSSAEMKDEKGAGAKSADSDQPDLKRKKQQGSSAEMKDEKGAGAKSADSDQLDLKRKKQPSAAQGNGTGENTTGAAETKGGDVKATASDETNQKIKRKNQKAQPGTPETKTQGSAETTNIQRGSGKSLNAESSGSAGGANTASRQTDVDVTGSINVDRSAAARMRDTLMRNAERTDIDVDVRVGTPLPDRVRLRRLPPDIVEIAPEFRSYDYVVVRDEIIIVQPKTRKVVTVIRGSADHASARRSTGIELSSAQRERIRRIVTERKTRSFDVDLSMGEDVPDTVELEPLPSVVSEDVPELRGYDFFMSKNDIYLVAPDTREVVEVVR